MKSAFLNGVHFHRSPYGSGDRAFLFLTPKHTILKKDCQTLATYIFVNSQWIFCFNDSFCRARDQLSKMVQNFIVALIVPEIEPFFTEHCLCISSQLPKNIQIIKVFWFILIIWFLTLIPTQTGNRFITMCVDNDKLPTKFVTCSLTLVEVGHSDNKEI